MNHAPLAFDLQLGGQDDDGASPCSRERMMERAQRLNFLKQSARYLGRTLTDRQLHSLIVRVGP
jgi:hypothetical protein